MADALEKPRQQPRETSEDTCESNLFGIDLLCQSNILDLDNQVDKCHGPGKINKRSTR